MQPSSDQPLASSKFFSRGWAPLVLVTAGVLAFANAIPGEFVWVDEVEILEGGYRLADWQDLKRVWTLTLDQYLHRDSAQSPSQGGYFRPVYAHLITLDWWLFRDQSTGYHVVNILWHLAVVLGLYQLGQRIYDFLPEAKTIAFAAAMIFAVHPLGTHSVTWISGRKDSACAALAIGALLAMAQAVDRSQASTLRRCLWSTLSLLLLWLALGCKELAAMTPIAGFLLLCVDWRPEHDRLRSGWKWGMLTAGLMLGSVAALLVYRSTVLGGATLGASYPVESVWGNLAMSAKLFWHYVLLVLVPHRPLVSDAWPLVESFTVGGLAAMLGVLVFAALLFWGTWCRWVWVPACWWLVIWLTPAMGMVPLRHVRAERYLYPASWGLVLLVCVVAVAASRWRELPRFRILASSIWGLWLVASLTVTVWSNVYWWNDQSLFADSVARSPKHLEGLTALSREALDGKNYAAAIGHIESLEKLNQKRSHTGYWSPWVAYSNQGLAYYQRGRHSTQQLATIHDQTAVQQKIAEAKADYTGARIAFEKALTHQPHHAQGHYHLGATALAVGDAQAAEKALRAALKRDPEHLKAGGDLGYLLLHLNRPTEVVELLRPLVERYSHDKKNRANLGSALLLLGEFDQAHPHFQWLVREDASDVANRAKLAWCQWKSGKKESAEQHLKLALQQEPQNPVALGVQRIMRGP